MNDKYRFKVCRRGADAAPALYDRNVSQNGGASRPHGMFVHGIIHNIHSGCPSASDKQWIVRA